MQTFSWKALATGLGLVATATLAGCEQKTATEQQPIMTEAAPATPAATAAYICPMGCEGSASDKPGNCPVCEMKLEPNPAAKAAAPDSL